MISRETFDRWQKEVEEHLNLLNGCDTGCRPSISGIMHFESALGVPSSRHVSSKPPAEEIDYIVVEEPIVKKPKMQRLLLRRTKNIMKKRYALT